HRATPAGGPRYLRKITSRPAEVHPPPCATSRSEPRTQRSGVSGRARRLLRCAACAARTPTAATHPLAPPPPLCDRRPGRPEPRREAAMTRGRRRTLLAAGVALALGLPAAARQKPEASPPPRPREYREVGNHKGGAAGVGISPDGKQVASGGGD